MKTNTTTKKTTQAKPAANKSQAAFSSQNGKTKASESTENNEEKEDNESKETPFEKLFVNMLKDIYWAEQHLVESIPQMIEAATTTGLKNAFDEHLHVTKRHVKRLERVFELLDETAEAKKCVVMEALVKEGQKTIEETEDGSMTRDAGLIISAQKIEHYEIASYGSLVQVALTLGHNEAASVLEKTLNEEEQADRDLTDIAETDVNPLADEETSESEEEGKTQKEEYAIG